MSTTATTTATTTAAPAVPQREAITVEPYNAQTPRDALRPDRTPVGACFVRNHFAVPHIEPAAWRLRLLGAVRRPVEITYAELASLPSKGVGVVLECAGNGRSAMAPRPPGLAWGERAVGCVRFDGVPFRALAARAGIQPSASEVVFAGADSGVAHGRRARFERSLPVGTALHPDTLLATHMNGQPLTPEHGAPVRLVVPGWYGVSSVKWLVETRAVNAPFAGPFQTEQYVYRTHRDEPVTTMLVKSMITDPAPDAVLPAGRPVEIRGHAWSAAPVGSVDVSVDGGRTWCSAHLAARDGRYAWITWSLKWTPPHRGRYRLLARARDLTAAVQPLSAPWNALGYGNNVVSSIEVRVQ